MARRNFSDKHMRITHPFLYFRQPNNIPPTLGIFVYQFSYTFAYIQCVMNFTIALNRSVAVWWPLRYKAIFNKKLCCAVSILICFQALSVVSLYFIFPCQHIGYGPRSYANVFVKCSSGVTRDYSVLAKLLNKICFVLACCGTGMINLTTFCKIVYIRIVAKARYNNKDFKRDVRLFSLAVVQDILMTIIVFSIILFNNEENLDVIGVLLSYDGLIFIYVFNNASMAFCNPECRRYLFRTKAPVVLDNYTTTMGGISTVVLPNSLPTLPTITVVDRYQR
uniref:7TM_GPCR_Srx domain-containing protein n=1 Tax=Steinernema glaseri TaxID=37863 RepID=A0A1I8AL04_9BILA